MSSKSSRKATNTILKAPEPIITRTKSAQQRRQLRNKVKKTEKSKLTKPEIKSPKRNRTVKCSKGSLLKPESSVDFNAQEEYYPNNLKRDICTKKVMLKPKHNFKVVAATNKRKLATPQKGNSGLKSPPSKHSSPRNLPKQPKRSRIPSRACSSPEPSMQDMIRILDENRSLSDEDFMEILTCPSPVWWEDLPNGEFDEDSIHTRSLEPSPERTSKDTKRREITTNTKSSKPNKMITIEQNNEQPIVEQNKKDEKFIKKKQKLESILGNIMNKSMQNIQTKNEIKTDESNDRNRKKSESEGDISDLSFNEEEILKNLENMEIPIEQSLNELDDSLDIKKAIDEIDIVEEPIKKYENEIASKNDNVVMKPEIKEVSSIKSSDFDNDSIPNTSSQFKSDVSLGEMNSNTDKKSHEIVIVDTNSCLDFNEDSKCLTDEINSFNNEIGNKIPKNNSLNVNDANNSNTVNKNEISNDKIDQSEFITVYKIIPDTLNSENELKPAGITKKTKLDIVRGKLNNFFKHCKHNIRLKKTENLSAIPLTGVKEKPTDNEKQNGEKNIDLEDDKNRLKSCDYCVEKTENESFSCDECAMAPILPCDLCNFLAETKESYRKHVSTCEDDARLRNVIVGAYF